MHNIEESVQKTEVTKKCGISFEMSLLRSLDGYARLYHEGNRSAACMPRKCSFNNS